MLTRRQRLTNIIRALSQREPRFEVVIGNNSRVNPFLQWKREYDVLSMMTEEGLEITARFLVQDRASTNRNNERNQRLARTAAE